MQKQYYKWIIHRKSKQLSHGGFFLFSFSLSPFSLLSFFLPLISLSLSLFSFSPLSLLSFFLSPHLFLSLLSFFSLFLLSLSPSSLFLFYSTSSLFFLLSFSVSLSGSKTSLLNIIAQLKKCCNHPLLFPGASEKVLFIIYFLMKK